MAKIIILAAVNSKGYIGKNGDLLYHGLKNDMENFKRVTDGNVVIMGSRTFESLPNGAPLKNRTNIIISHNHDYSIEPSDNSFIVNSITEAVELCESLFSDKKVFVIGGGSIYRAFMDMGLVDELRLTEVLDDAEGDITFPSFDKEMYDVTFETLPMRDSEEVPYYKYITYKRKTA